MTERNLHFIDLFAGCGGLSLGLEQAGFRPLLFSEINEDAAATYLLNRPDFELVNYPDVYSLSNDELVCWLRRWQTEMGVGDIDLVCGGPPCQGYSGIGIRRTFDLDKHEIPSNFLYKEMVRVIQTVRPRLFLFENVKGLLTSRWAKNGTKGEVFGDVLGALVSVEGYRVRWQLVHAKDYGVPQNRPRVLVVGIREDVAPVLPAAVFDKHGVLIQSAIHDGLLPTGTYIPPDPLDLLGDLIDPEYREKGETREYLYEPTHAVQRELRKRRDGGLLAKGDTLTEQVYSHHSEAVTRKFQHMIVNGGEIPPEFRTKKFSQRVIPSRWSAKGPHITATSLPDDYVHFAQPRILTVREWARLQTFPDWYQFAGSRTTGGRRRAGDPSKGLWDREVPKYTQIGNAVPVFLANAVGLHLARLLSDGK